MSDLLPTNNNQAEEKLLVEFDYDQLITEDDTPVSSIAAEKQQRLLIDSLYSSFKKQKFWAACNVGIFYAFEEPPLVPTFICYK